VNAKRNKKEEEQFFHVQGFVFRLRSVQRNAQNVFDRNWVFEMGLPSEK
jgi:hypothetical protein